MVHGWNSDIDQARALYTNLFTQFSRTRETHAVRQPCAALGNPLAFGEICAARAGYPAAQRVSLILDRSANS